MSQLGLFEAPPDPLAWLYELEDQRTDPDGARWYQREAIDAVHKAFADGDRSTLVVAATGTGKTRMFSTIARHWPGDVLVLAHRGELVEQARDALESLCGELVDVEMGQLRAGRRARIVVASVDSIKQQRRLDRHGADRFSLVIVDEAHHYTAKTYRRPIEFFKDAKVLGVTATPDRGDEQALGKVFDSVSYVFDILQGIQHGYLVPLTGHRVQVSEIDLSGVDVVAGDLVAAQLDEAMIKAVEGIVVKTLELGGERQGVAFFPGVRSAELAAERFNALRPGCAAFISGMTDPVERRRVTRDFKAGRYQYLCNCQVATEGFDAPAASLIIQGRPTKSRALYAQMVGRGTRVLPGLVDFLEGKDLGAQRRAIVAASKKPNCLILDFVGNSGRHELMTPEDLLGGDYDDAEVAAAKELAKKDPGGDAQKHLAEARHELRRLASSVKTKDVKATVHKFDPFALLDLECDDEIRYSRYSAPATRGQLDVLRHKGVDERDLESLSKRGAKALLDQVRKRQSDGLCTFKQLRCLQRYGISKPDVSFEAAGKALSYVFDECGRGKKRPVDPKVLNSICFGERLPGED